MMLRTLVMLYALACYAIGFGALIYIGGFMIDVGVPKGIDAAAQADWPLAVIVNVVLLAMFCLQHSVMARLRFKLWWTRLVPPPIERATYVLLSSLAFGLLMALWQPIGALVYEIQAPAGVTLMYALYGIGWMVMVAASFHIDHFELFGLRQAWAHFIGRPADQVPFSAVWLYALVRHPISLGWLLVAWATPRMSAGHALLASALTVYIVVATMYEERDLRKVIGSRYDEYRRRVNAFLPWPRVGGSIGPWVGRKSGRNRHFI